MKVSIVIPTLDEEDGIGPTLAALDRAAFQARGWDLEVLVIDGQSKDGTAARAVASGAQVVVEPRRGYGRAYKTGFAAATGDIVVTGDADASYPFERAHEFVAVLERDGLDFLTCNRYAQLAPGAMRPLHRLGNWALSATTRLLLGARLQDSQSGMWVLRRSRIAALDIAALPDGMAFSQAIKVEALRRFGARSKEVPASLRPRVGKPVLSSWRDGLGNLMALWRRRLTGRWA